MTVRLDAGVTATRAIGPMLEDNDDTNTSATIDLLTAPHGARVLLLATVGTRTDGTFTFTLEQSDNDSDYTTVSPVTGSMAAISAANTQRTAGYQPSARYVRVKCVASATTDGALISATVLTIDP